DGPGGHIVGDALPAGADRPHARGDEVPAAGVAVLPGVARGVDDVHAADPLHVGARGDLHRRAVQGGVLPGQVVVLVQVAVRGEDVGHALPGHRGLDATAQGGPALAVVVLPAPAGAIDDVGHGPALVVDPLCAHRHHPGREDGRDAVDDLHHVAV